MRQRRTPHDRPIERGLNLAFGAAILVAVGSIVMAFLGGAGWQAVGACLLLPLSVIVYVARFRHPRTLGLATALAAPVLLISVSPALGSTTVLLTLVTQVVIAFDVGFALGAVMSILYVATWGTVAVLFMDASLQGAVLENAFSLLLLLLAAGVGSLMRTAERNRAEAATVGAELSRANTSLRRSLSLERDLVLAEEQARSARELHDGLGHRLTLIALSLEYAQQARGRHPDQAWAEVVTAADTNREALAEMRLWVRALDPPAAAEGATGAAAFNAIADAFRGTGLDVGVSFHGEERLLGRDAALFATRFMQEGLTNVLRHAEATHVAIDVIQSPHQVRLSIGDDGKETASSAEGFGRRSLRERAEMLGGAVTSGRSGLGGFELTAIIPLAVED